MERRFRLTAVLHASANEIAMKRPTILPALILSGIFALSCFAQSEKRPNIVIILVDDMGWSDIASYGGEIPTPNLDALAKNGVRFTQFYNTARCSPSRASLLTGHYPHQAGMGYLDNLIRQDSLGYQGKISNRSVTIAEVLKASGYFTAMTGKWHLGQQNGTPPWKRGFDRSLNISAGGIFFPNQSGNPNDPLSSRAREPLYLNGAALAHNAPQLGQDWYTTYLWTDFGLKFIDEALNEKKPFFLYLAHNAPHFPLMAPRELIAKYKGKYMAGWDKLREERYRRQLKMGLIDPKWPLSPRAADTPAWDSLPQAERERYDHMMAVYAAMIEAIDTSVGTLVKGLKERQALDNTLILFLSDNGGNGEAGPKGRSEGTELGSKDSTVFIGMNWAAVNNTPFRRFKHFAHEGGISTPLIAHWPAGIPKTRNGKLEHQQGHLIDIMPTVVEITGAKYPAESGGQAIYPMEGVSLRPAFNGKPLKRAEPIFFEHEGNRAIRFGKWKLVSKYMDVWELYDLAADRTELNNLAERHPDVVKDLSARWEAWAKRTHTDQWIGPRRNEWGEVPRP